MISLDLLEGHSAALNPWRRESNGRGQGPQRGGAGLLGRRRAMGRVVGAEGLAALLGGAALGGAGGPEARAAGPTGGGGGGGGGGAGRRERSEAHRARGNELFRRGDFEGAVDFYTRAMNADRGSARAACNRGAALSALGRHREALADAALAADLEEGWAKPRARAAVAHFYLREYDAAFHFYQEALRLDPQNEEYRKGLGEAEERGGSAAGYEREVYRRTHREEAKAQAEAEAQAEGRRAALAQAAKEERERMRREEARAAYRRDLAEFRRKRREGAERWQKSTGLEGAPEEMRGRSIRIDVFGALRGRCEAAGCSGWARDTEKLRGWNDMQALQCENCGRAHTEHENLGPYPTMHEEPKDPEGPQKKETIKGLHDARRCAVK